MMKIILSDSQQQIEYNDYWGDDAIKFMLNFKKIFPSVSDLLLPILGDESDDLDQISWQSTTQNFAIFSQLVQEWTTIELRLNSLAQLQQFNYNRDKATILLKQAREQRQRYVNQPQRTPKLWADWVFLRSLHATLDAELSVIAMPFYSPTLFDTWRKLLPKEVFSQTLIPLKLVSIS